jgi:transcriptional regulator with XRE-family HTH domain
MPIMVDLVQNRRLLGLNQEQMAERCDVSKKVIVDAENGNLKASTYASTLRKLANGYGCTIADIETLCGRPPMPVASAPQ